MKESYLPELNEMCQKIAAKLQQHDSLPQQPNSGQVKKLKLFKTMLELAITFLQVKSITPNSLSSAISDIGSVMSMTDRIAGSAPGNGSRALVRDDLVAMTNSRLQVKNFLSQDGTNGTRKMKRNTSASGTSDLESTATFCIKRPWVEFNHALLEEIREINQQLIDTVVDISDEDVDPSAAVADSLLQLERVILTLFTYNSKENEDLSVKAKSMFSISLRSLSQPMFSISPIMHSRAVEAHSAQSMGLGRTVRVLVSNFSMRT